MRPKYKHIIIKALPATILFVTVQSVIGFVNISFLWSKMNNTTLWWSISGIILIIYGLATYYFYDRANRGNMIFIYLYMAWAMICVIRGAFVAEMYWDWKLLTNNFMIFMLTLISFAATNKVLMQSLLSYYVKYLIPLFIVFFMIIRTDAYGFYLMGVSTMLLFFPVFTLRQKFILIICTAIVLFSDLGARSNILKFLIPALMLVPYYYRKLFPIKILELLRLLMFVLPITLFILGATDIFNVFKIKEYMNKDVRIMGLNERGVREEESLIGDTRTFLYEEVINSAIDNKYVFFGRTPARGNDSNTFGLIQFQWTGRYERESNEIGLANTFTWLGLVGVIIYSLIFYHASFLAVNRSNNIFIRLMGLYIAFRWFYSWIEDHQTFSLNYLMLIAMWGMCLSESFRKMTDKQFMIWARGIFDARWIKFDVLVIKKEINEK